MTQAYDVIIIGATPAGIALAEKLGAAGLLVNLLSSNFIYKTSKHKLDNVTCTQGTAVLLSYSYGLLGVNFTTQTGNSAVFGYNIVLATGDKPIKATLRNSNILYKAIDAHEKQKAASAVVYGNTDAAATYALELSKKFGYVYHCTKDFDLLCNTKLKKKLNDTPNIVHLPSCTVLSCKNDKNGKLTNLTLDTYATINTSTLVFATGRLPDVPAFSKRYILTDSEGFAVVDANGESSQVPGVYAIGSLCKTFTNKDLKHVAEHIINKKK
jgi:thioredoxin reductase